jgi:hypothetical protein
MVDQVDQVRAALAAAFAEEQRVAWPVPHVTMVELSCPEAHNIVADACYYWRRCGPMQEQLRKMFSLMVILIHTVSAFRFLSPFDSALYHWLKNEKRKSPSFEELLTSTRLNEGS